MRIIKATEGIFDRSVITCKSGITNERNIDLRIESAVVEQFGHGILKMLQTISLNIR